MLDDHDLLGVAPAVRPAAMQAIVMATMHDHRTVAPMVGPSAMMAAVRADVDALS
jgi:hypothetical protein